MNPLAVLSAKGSLAVYMAPYLDPPHEPIRLPIYLADAINPAALEADGSFAHVLQTEIGPRSFRLPASLVQRPEFLRIFGRVRELVDAGVGAAKIVDAVELRQVRTEIDGATTASCRKEREAMLGVLKMKTLAEAVSLNGRGEGTPAQPRPNGL